MAQHLYDAPPLAYDVRGLTKACGRGRSMILNDIHAGRLTARRAGGKLIILYEDAKTWLQSLPLHEAPKAEAVNDAG